MQATNPSCMFRAKNAPADAGAFLMSFYQDSGGNNPVLVPAKAKAQYFAIFKPLNQDQRIRRTTARVICTLGSM